MSDVIAQGNRRERKRASSTPRNPLLRGTARLTSALQRRTSSLLTRTAFALAISAVLIAATSVMTLQHWVLAPMSERWAADEAGLLELAARTWVSLPESQRFDFELSLAQRHDLLISEVSRDLRKRNRILTDASDDLMKLRDELADRLGTPVVIVVAEDLIWIEMQIGKRLVQVGLSPNRRAVQAQDVFWIIVIVVTIIVLVTAVVIVGRLTGPLSRAAGTAESFRGLTDIERLPEEGPSELRTLARSFNNMAREIANVMQNRTTFLAGVSHDLRTPIARMRLAVELLPPEVDPVLTARLLRNLAEMEDLLSVALQFARGVSDEEIALVGLKQLVAEVLHPEGNPRARLVWSGPDDLLLPLPVGAMRRVLQNLLGNAERYGSGNALELWVSVLDDRVEFQVLDRGSGIPEEYHDQVFEPFFRVDGSRSARTGGSGLGLAIVKQLCEAHGWRVQVRSRVGGGTEVCVSVPREQYA